MITDYRALLIRMTAYNMYMEELMGKSPKHLAVFMDPRNPHDPEYDRRALIWLEEQGFDPVDTRDEQLETLTAEVNRLRELAHGINDDVMQAENNVRSPHGPSDSAYEEFHARSRVIDGQDA